MSMKNSSRLFVWILRNCPNLERIFLSCTYSGPFGSLNQSVPRMKNLTTLKIHGLKTNRRELRDLFLNSKTLLPNFSLLKVLKLSSLQLENNDPAIWMGHLFAPFLESLTITWNDDITTKDVLTFLLSSFHLFLDLRRDAHAQEIERSRLFWHPR